MLVKIIFWPVVIFCAFFLVKFFFTILQGIYKGITYDKEKVAKERHERRKRLGLE